MGNCCVERDKTTGEKKKIEKGSLDAAAKLK